MVAHSRNLVAYINFILRKTILGIYIKVVTVVFGRVKQLQSSVVGHYIFILSMNS